MCIYVYQRFSAYKHTTQTDPFYTKEGLIQHAITKEFMYTICLKRKVHTKFKENTTAAQHTGKLHVLLNLRRGKEKE